MKTYTVGGGWGDAIHFSPEWIKNSDKQRVCGWKHVIPSVGDVMKVPMASGNNLLFKFINVTKMGDPPDMFVADVEAIGYEET